MPDVDAVTRDWIDQSVQLERAGRIGDALARARAALEHARTQEDAEGIAAALVCVATLRFRLGQFDLARTLAEQALALAAPDSRARAEAFLRIGACAAALDNKVEAETFYQRAAELSREINYPLARFQSLHSLAGSIYVPRGKFDLALTTAEEAYRIVCEHHLREWADCPLITLAYVCLASGEHLRARAIVAELGTVALPGSRGQAYHFCFAAELALGEGDTETARQLYAQARSIAEAIGDPMLNVYLRLGWSATCRASGDAAGARDWADDAVTLATRVGFRHERANALIERGRAYWANGDARAAETDWRAAIQILGALGAAFDLARARLFLAALLRAQERAEADAAWREAAHAILDGNYVFLLEQTRALTFPLVAVYLNGPDAECAELARALVSHLARVPPPPLHIVTLGAFEVRQGARPVAKRALRKRRAGALLALLLLTPSHTLTFDQIADTLWCDQDPAAAQALFHQATSALRRALEPELPDKFPSRYVLVEEKQVTLHLPAGSTVDFQIFEEHCRAERWDAALAAYRGDWLPDDLYADWAIVPRERLKRLYLRALTILAHRQMKAGHARETLDLCYRILELDPWQEDAVLLGMRACLMFNDRAGAVRLYHALERTLREELNTTPQAALRDLYQAVIRGQRTEGRELFSVH